MQLTEFQHRLDQLLDERRDPRSDKDVQSALKASPACREILENYEMTLDSLSLDSPDVPDHFAENIAALSLQDTSNIVAIDQAASSTTLINRIEPSQSKWIAILAPVAIAASIVLFLVLRNMPNPDGQNPTRNTLDNIASNNPLLLPNQQEDYLLMMRKTGQVLATFPNTVRRASTTEEFDSVATPVTYSVSTALDLLIDVLPESTTNPDI